MSVLHQSCIALEAERLAHQLEVLGLRTSQRVLEMALEVLQLLPKLLSRFLCRDLLAQ